MKRRLLALTLAGMMALSLAACGQSGTTTPSSNGGSSEETSLTYAVEAGSAGEAMAQEKGFTYNSVASQADALMEVASGTSDAAIIDLLMAGAMIGEGTSYPDLTYTVRLTEEDYGVGCRKGSDLTDFINEQLKVLYDDDTIAELAEQYGISDNIVPQE